MLAGEQAAASTRGGRLMTDTCEPTAASLQRNHVHTLRAAALSQQLQQPCPTRHFCAVLPLHSAAVQTPSCRHPHPTPLNTPPPRVSTPIPHPPSFKDEVEAATAYDCAAYLLVGPTGAVNFGAPRAVKVLPSYIARINLPALRRLKEALAAAGADDGPAALDELLRSRGLSSGATTPAAADAADAADADATPAADAIPPDAELTTGSPELPSAPDAASAPPPADSAAAAAADPASSCTFSESSGAAGAAAGWDASGGGGSCCTTPGPAHGAGAFSPLTRTFSGPVGPLAYSCPLPVISSSSPTIPSGPLPTFLGSAAAPFAATGATEALLRHPSFAASCTTEGAAAAQQLGASALQQHLPVPLHCRKNSYTGSLFPADVAWAASAPLPRFASASGACAPHYALPQYGASSCYPVDGLMTFVGDGDDGDSSEAHGCAPCHITGLFGFTSPNSNSEHRPMTQDELNAVLDAQLDSMIMRMDAATAAAAARGGSLAASPTLGAPAPAPACDFGRSVASPGYDFGGVLETVARTGSLGSFASGMTTTTAAGGSCYGLGWGGTSGGGAPSSATSSKGAAAPAPALAPLLRAHSSNVAEAALFYGWAMEDMDEDE